MERIDENGPVLRWCAPEGASECRHGAVAGQVEDDLARRTAAIGVVTEPLREDPERAAIDQLRQRGRGFGVTTALRRQLEKERRIDAPQDERYREPKTRDGTPAKPIQLRTPNMRARMISTLPSAPPKRRTGPSIDAIAVDRTGSGKSVTSIFCAGS